MTRLALLALVLVALLAGCSDSDDSTDATTSTAESAQMFPDVVAAVATQTADGAWDFSVTVSSPYDSDDRYADAWKIEAPDGAVLGERILAHPHANEQPFTRSLPGVAVPDGVQLVTISARDSVNGYGDGDTVDIELTAQPE